MISNEWDAFLDAYKEVKNEAEYFMQLDELFGAALEFVRGKDGELANDLQARYLEIIDGKSSSNSKHGN